MSPRMGKGTVLARRPVWWEGGGCEVGQQAGDIRNMLVMSAEGKE